MVGDKFDPVAEARKRYPGLKDWDDRRILDNLRDPARFRSAFPEYKDLPDDVIQRNMASYKPTNSVLAEMEANHPVELATGRGWDEENPILAKVYDNFIGPIFGEPLSKDAVKMSEVLKQEALDQHRLAEEVPDAAPMPGMMGGKKLLHRALSVANEAAALPYMMAGMTPAEFGLTVGSAVVPGAQGVAPAYWMTRGTGNAMGLNAEGRSSVLHAMEEPTPDNVQMAIFDAGAPLPAAHPAGRLALDMAEAVKTPYKGYYANRKGSVQDPMTRGEVYASAREQGIDMNLAQASESPFWRNREAGVEVSPGGSRRINQAHDVSEAQWLGRFNEIRDGLGPEVDVISANNKTKRLVELADDVAHTNASAAYDGIDSLMHGPAVNTAGIKNVARAIRRDMATANKMNPSLAPGDLIAVLDEIEQYPDWATFGTMHRVKSRLNKAIFKNDPVMGESKSLQWQLSQALDESMRKAAVESGNARALQAYDAAQASWAEYMNDFRSPDSPFGRILAAPENTTTPLDQLLGPGAGNVRLMQAFNKHISDPYFRQEIQRSFLDRLADPKGNEFTTTPDAYPKRLANYSDPYLQELFRDNPEILRQIRELGEVGKSLRLNKRPINRSIADEAMTRQGLGLGALVAGSMMGEPGGGAAIGAATILGPPAVRNAMSRVMTNRRLIDYLMGYEEQARGGDAPPTSGGPDVMMPPPTDDGRPSLLRDLERSSTPRRMGDRVPEDFRTDDYRYPMQDMVDSALERDPSVPGAMDEGVSRLMREMEQGREAELMSRLDAGEITPEEFRQLMSSEDPGRSLLGLLDETPDSTQAALDELARRHEAGEIDALTYSREVAKIKGTELPEPRTPEEGSLTEAIDHDNADYGKIAEDAAASERAVQKGMRFKELASLDDEALAEAYEKVTGHELEDGYSRDRAIFEILAEEFPNQNRSKLAADMEAPQVDLTKDERGQGIFVDEETGIDALRALERKSVEELQQILREMLGPDEAMFGEVIGSIDEKAMLAEEILVRSKPSEVKGWAAESTGVEDVSPTRVKDFASLLDETDKIEDLIGKGVTLDELEDYGFSDKALEWARKKFQGEAEKALHPGELLGEDTLQRKEAEGGKWAEDEKRLAGYLGLESLDQLSELTPDEQRLSSLGDLLQLSEDVLRQALKDALEGEDPYYWGDVFDDMQDGSLSKRDMAIHLSKLLDEEEISNFLKEEGIDPTFSDKERPNLTDEINIEFVHSQDGHSHNIQVMDNGKKIGILVTHPAKGVKNAVQVGLSNLAKNYRGRGLGKKLYQEAIDWARSEGYDFMVSDRPEDMTDASNRLWQSLKKAGFDVRVVNQKTHKYALKLKEKKDD